MKESKKEILDKIDKLSRKGKKTESLALNMALQKLDSDKFELEGNAVYTAGRKRLVYMLGDDKDVTVPTSVEVIGEMAFIKKPVKTVTLPEGLKKIERCAFSDCDALESVTIPASVDEIEGYAFEDCDQLKSVTFEGTPKKLSRQAFADCDELHRISVPEDGVKAVCKALHLDDDSDVAVVGRPENAKAKKADKAEKPDKPKGKKKATNDKE